MTLLTRENVTMTPLVEGDCGVILKEDGTFRIFNGHTGMDAKNLTDAQRAQGEKLVALALALQVPQVMNILFDLAKDPTIAGATLDLGLLN